MGMSFAVIYHPLVKKIDLPKLDAAIKQRLKTAIEQKLMTRPEHFGIPLRHSQEGARKLRVGDYRIVFCIVGAEVRVYTIEHRSIVYKALSKRVPFKTDLTS